MTKQTRRLLCFSSLVSCFQINKVDLKTRGQITKRGNSKKDTCLAGPPKALHKCVAVLNCFVNSLFDPTLLVNTQAYLSMLGIVQIVFFFLSLSLGTVLNSVVNFLLDL